MNRSFPVAALFVTAGITATLAGFGQNDGDGSGSRDAAAAGASANRVRTPQQTPGDLADALLTPAEVGRVDNSLSGLTVNRQQQGTGGLTGPVSGLRFISGDSACRTVVDPHSVESEAAAWVGMSKETTDGMSDVYEEISAFSGPSDARDLMRQNSDRLENCRNFVAESMRDGQRFSFSFKPLSLPELGDQSSAFRLDGTAVDDPETVWDSHEIEIRMGSDVIWVNSGGMESDEDRTVALAEAALDKYNRVLNR
jgi:hypothetical protein